MVLTDDTPMQVSSGHSILEIDEILQLILPYCDKPTLASLARTTRACSDAALDELWRTLESFAHLLKTFPPDLISWIEQPVGPGPMPTVNHLIVPRDWKRFSQYAQRIRSWLSEDLSYIEEPLVDHIAFGRNPDYILPQLQHMEVSGTTVSGLHLQTLMLCPTLESVTVYNADPSSWVTRSMNTFLRTLSDRAPRLKKLTLLWGNVITPHFVDGLSDFLSQELADLKTLNLRTTNCINANGFTRLGRLPNLTSLQLNLRGVTRSLASRIQSISPAFTTLEYLLIAGETDGFHELLRCFGNAPRIMSLSFLVYEYPKAHDLQELFETISSQFPSARSLQLNVSRPQINTAIANQLYDTNPELYHHDKAVLQPLLAMRHLATLRLDLGVSVSLSDVDLFTLGSSWPSIKTLTLGVEPCCESALAVRPAATVIGLLAITEACPNLQHLGLLMDCTSGISDGMIAGTSAASRALIHLDVGRSRISEPPVVAALLSGAFPNLNVFRWWGMNNTPEASLQDGYASGWKQVFELLPVFRAVRASERRDGAKAFVVDGKMSMVVD